MPNPDSEGIVSESDLAYLTDLFRRFEGATDPLSIRVREIEWEFNSLIETIFLEKVKPHFESLTLSQFRSHARNVYRRRIPKESPPFPCP